MTQPIKIQFNEEVLNYYNRLESHYPCFSVNIRFSNGEIEELKSFHESDKHDLIEYINCKNVNNLQDDIDDYDDVVDEVFINYEYINYHDSVNYELVDTLYCRE